MLTGMIIQNLYIIQNSLNVHVPTLGGNIFNNKPCTAESLSTQPPVRDSFDWWIREDEFVMLFCKHTRGSGQLG